MLLWATLERCRRLSDHPAALLLGSHPSLRQLQLRNSQGGPQTKRNAFKTHQNIFLLGWMLLQAARCRFVMAVTNPAAAPQGRLCTATVRILLLASHGT